MVLIAALSLWEGMGHQESLCESEEERKESKQMTNYEKIRSMSIDEMARFFCAGDRACKGCAFRGNDCLCKDAVEVHRKWLEAEANPSKEKA